jgi:hypothetical protein
MGLLGNQEQFDESIEQIVQSICASSITLNLSRIDTKQSHRFPSIYKADTTYFQTTQLRAFIRESRIGEFDYSPSSGLSMESYPTLQFQAVAFPNEPLKSVKRFIPKLWVLVTDLDNGTHHVSSIYRGPAMWKVVEREGIDTASFHSPTGLTEALAKIQACEGFDIPAWRRFVKEYWNACVYHAAVIDTKGMAIN